MGKEEFLLKKDKMKRTQNPAEKGKLFSEDHR